MYILFQFLVVNIILIYGMAIKYHRKQGAGRHRFLHSDVSIQWAVADENSVIKTVQMNAYTHGGTTVIHCGRKPTQSAQKTAFSVTAESVGKSPGGELKDCPNYQLSTRYSSIRCAALC